MGGFKAFGGLVKALVKRFYTLNLGMRLAKSIVIAYAMTRKAIANELALK